MGVRKDWAKDSEYCQKEGSGDSKRGPLGGRAAAKQWTIHLWWGKGEGGGGGSRGAREKIVGRSLAAGPGVSAVRRRGAELKRPHARGK